MSNDSKVTLLENQLELLKDWDADLSRRELHAQTSLAVAAIQPSTEFAFEAASWRRYLLSTIAGIGVERTKIALYDLHAAIGARFPKDSADRIDIREILREASPYRRDE